VTGRTSKFGVVVAGALALLPAGAVASDGVWHYIGPPGTPTVANVAFVGGSAPRLVAGVGRAGSLSLASRAQQGGAWTTARLVGSATGLTVLNQLAGANKAQIGFAAAGGLGTLRSLDGGRTWSVAGGNEGGGFVASSARGQVAVAAATDNGAATAEIRLSVDRGATWRRVPLKAGTTEVEDWNVSALALDGARPKTIYVAGSGRFVGDPIAGGERRRGVLVSRDGGKSWTFRGTGRAGVPGAVTPATGRAGLVFVTTPEGTFRSRNYGAGWSRVTRLARTSLTFSPGFLVIDSQAAPSVFWGNGLGIWVGCKAGTVWKRVTASKAGRTSVASIALSPDGGTLAASGRPGVSLRSTRALCP
jgi:hypothetical protein